MTLKGYANKERIQNTTLSHSLSLSLSLSLSISLALSLYKIPTKLQNQLKALSLLCTT